MDVEKAYEEFARAVREGRYYRVNDLKGIAGLNSEAREATPQQISDVIEGLDFRVISSWMIFEAGWRARGDCLVDDGAGQGGLIMPEEISRIPKNVDTAAYEIESFEVASWCPSRDGKGPATQVWFVIHIKGGPAPLVMRLKSARAADELIGALQRHRADVWPTP